MNYKNLFMLFSVGILSTLLLADNPGDDAVNDEPVAVETAEESVEQVVAEEETSPAGNATENEEGAVVLEKVVVTGSKIKKAQVEGPLPLLVITKSDIDNSGFRNLTEVLQSIPSANAGTQNESKNNSFTPNANELDLRNLGPGRILYLVNGRRTADYPLPFNNAGNIANIGVIPNGLIDRIEVLSQGASAIYGSDAVTGVVNVITVKGKDFQELDVDFMETQYEQKNQYSVAYTAGGFFGNSSWTVGLDYTHVDPMTYADRPGHDSFVNDPDYGIAYTAPRYGLYFRTSNGQNGWYGSSEFPSTPTCEGLSGGDFFDFDKQDPEWLYNGSYPGRGCGYDYGSERFGGKSQTIVNERDDLAAMFSFTHNFDNGIELNSRLYSWKDEAFYRGYTRFWQHSGFLDPARIQALQATSTDPNNNISASGGRGSLTADYFLRIFSPSMGPNADSRNDITEEVNDFYVGLNGFFENGWEWEVGFNQTDYDYKNVKKSFTNAINDYMYGVGMTDDDGNLLTGSYRQWRYGYAYSNDFLNSLGLGDGPCGSTDLGRQVCFLPDRLMGEISNELMGSWLADDTIKANSSQSTLDVLVSGEFELLGKFVGFAVSADMQEQEYDLIPNENRLAGDVFITGSTIDGGGDRDRKSIGAEFALPVTDKLEMTLASRFDDYDDASSNVGSRLSNMVNFAYRPNSDLLIRGSFSETFRAPDMNYLFQANSSGFYNSATDWVKCYAYAQSGDPDYAAADFTECETTTPSIRGFFKGNPTLEEEEGENFQLGLVWSINDNSNLTIDAYQVVLENAVSRESITTLNLQEGLCLYGDDFQQFMGNNNITARDCSIVNSRIGRDDAVVDELSGDLQPIGEWRTVSPEYINQSSLEYQGIDWSYNYRVETENVGDFYINLSSSHILAVYQRYDTSSSEIEYLSTYTYEPRSQQNASISWVYQDFSTTLFMDRLGHMNMGDGSTSDPHIISNITTSYDYSPDINIYFSIRNLDDKMPQRDRSKSYPYYEQGYFSAFGRYYSAGFNYRF
jgi:outer membrane receptor for ferrienterochelin and colicin